MIFNKTDPNVKAEVLLKAESNLNKIITELALRKDNYFCGSGLGGNEFQLYTLLSMNNFLGRVKDIDIGKTKELVWNPTWINSSNRKTIRLRLNKIFPDIIEVNKNIGLLASMISTSTNYVDIIKENAQALPRLACAIDDRYKFELGLTNIEMLLHAFILCQELASLLDAKDYSKIEVIAGALAPMSPPIQLLSIRKHIGIERLVIHNLDENKFFEKLLQNVNNIVCD